MLTATVQQTTELHEYATSMDMTLFTPERILPLTHFFYLGEGGGGQIGVRDGYIL